MAASPTPSRPEQIETLVDGAGTSDISVIAVTHGSTNIPIPATPDSHFGNGGRTASLSGSPIAILFQRRTESSWCSPRSAPAWKWSATCPTAPWTLRSGEREWHRATRPVGCCLRESSTDGDGPSTRWKLGSSEYDFDGRGAVVARLNANGMLDPTFGHGVGAVTTSPRRSPDLANRTAPRATCRDGRYRYRQTESCSSRCWFPDFSTDVFDAFIRYAPGGDLDGGFGGSPYCGTMGAPAWPCPVCS